MARETKAERMEREARERAERLEAERSAYPLRLMNLLERATNLSTFELSVKNGMFYVRDQTANRYAEDYELAYAWSEHNQAVLENLTWKVESVEEELAEVRRRVEVKKEAERKVRELLSDEERELLGL
jgi:hypothetical protein